MSLFVTGRQGPKMPRADGEPSALQHSNGQARLVGLGHPDPDFVQTDVGAAVVAAEARAARRLRDNAAVVLDDRRAAADPHPAVAAVVERLVAALRAAGVPVRIPV